MSFAPLRDYQQQGVVWLRDRLAQHRAVLLGDEMGLGKTRQALAAAYQLHVERLLIICPAGARRVWQAEIETWLPKWSSHVVLVEPGTTLFDIQPKLSNLRPLVLIIGYDELSNLKSRIVPALKLVRWDLLVIDEAHFLKNPSKRTQAIYGRGGTQKGLEACAAKVILLSGTPTPNHAGELWQHVRTFWPWVPHARTLTQFEERFTRYRDTVFGRQIVGSQNQSELRDSLREVVLRRRKAEVLAELPPLQIQDVPLAKTPHLWGSFAPVAAQLREALAEVTDDEVLKALRQPDANVAALRQQLGLLKTPPTVVWVQERMLSVNKLLIFAWHHQVINALYRGLLEFNPVVVTGETPPSQRSRAIDLFQRDPGTRIFIGQILAAGTAITLTAAQEVVIVEPSWVPGENVQAIGRAHRLGQHDSVLASFLYLPGTLDQRIMQVFRRKAAEISELQGDQNADDDQSGARSGHDGGTQDVRPAVAGDPPRDVPPIRLRQSSHPTQGPSSWRTRLNFLRPIRSRRTARPPRPTLAPPRPQRRPRSRDRSRRFWDRRPTSMEMPGTSSKTRIRTIWGSPMAPRCRPAKPGTRGSPWCARPTPPGKSPRSKPSRKNGKSRNFTTCRWSGGTSFTPA